MVVFGRAGKRGGRASFASSANARHIIEFWCGEKRHCFTNLYFLENLGKFQLRACLLFLQLPRSFK